MVQNLNIIQWYTISIYRIYINHVQANRASSIQMYYKNVKSSDCVWFIWDLCWLERTNHDEIWWTNEVWFFRNWTPSQYLCGFTTSGICAHPNHLAFAASFHFESIGVGTSKSWRSWRVQQMCQSNVVMLQYDGICHMLWDRPQQCQVQYRQKLQCFCTICPFSFEEMGKGLLGAILILWSLLILAVTSCVSHPQPDLQSSLAHQVAERPKFALRLCNFRF